jgi:hypothetical protein
MTAPERSNRTVEAAMNRTRLTTIAILLGLPLVGLALVQVRPTEAGAVRQPASIRIDVGDVVSVAGAGIGCIVRQHDGAKALECRRAGSVAGTYGAIFDHRRVRVIRFRSGTVANTVFVARHRHRRTITCD